MYFEKRRGNLFSHPCMCPSRRESHSPSTLRWNIGWVVLGYSTCVENGSSSRDVLMLWGAFCSHKFVSWTFCGVMFYGLLLLYREHVPVLGPHAVKWATSLGRSSHTFWSKVSLEKPSPPGKGFHEKFCEIPVCCPGMDTL